MSVGVLLVTRGISAGQGEGRPAIRSAEGDPGPDALGSRRRPRGHITPPQASESPLSHLLLTGRVNAEDGGSSPPGAHGELLTFKQWFATSVMAVSRPVA